MKKVPNLVCNEAMDYCIYLNQHVPEEFDQFNFINVSTCEPFPMLITSAAIRQYRNRIIDHISHEIPPIHCENTYADTMRFYRATGINKGKAFEEDYGNSNYIPISKIEIANLRRESIERLEVIQERIVVKAKQISKVLSRGNRYLERMLTYSLTEVIRNVPEHSHADSIWYCTQYWPTKDLVELAFLDEGIGVKASLCSNYSLNNMIDSDEDALGLAIQPGISSSFSVGTNNNIKDEWANSGYGLYMISNLCAELGGDFIIASGDAAVKVQKIEKNIVKRHRKCHIKGTALRLRIRPSCINKYESIARAILNAGELSSRDVDYTIKHASKSSKSIFNGYEF